MIWRVPESVTRTTQSPPLATVADGDSSLRSRLFGLDGTSPSAMLDPAAGGQGSAARLPELLGADPHHLVAQQHRERLSVAGGLVHHRQLPVGAPDLGVIAVGRDEVRVEHPQAAAGQRLVNRADRALDRRPGQAKDRRFRTLLRAPGTGS